MSGTRRRLPDMNAARWSLPDSVLWARSRLGDDAFAPLFERHAKAIYNYCFRRIGD